MKLLLDENLSDRIINKIVDLYPDSAHVKAFALTNTDDALILCQKTLIFINVVYFTVIHLNLFFFVLVIVLHQKLYRF